jgi:hypothetical protein
MYDDFEESLCIYIECVELYMCMTIRFHVHDKCHWYVRYSWVTSWYWTLGVFCWPQQMWTQLAFSINFRRPCSVASSFALWQVRFIKYNMSRCITGINRTLYDPGFQGSSAWIISRLGIHKGELLQWINCYFTSKLTLFDGKLFYMNDLTTSSDCVHYRCVLHDLLELNTILALIKSEKWLTYVS